MLNNKDKEKIFDSVLSCAFEQAMKEEIDEMPDNSELAKKYQPSDKLRQDVDKIMNKQKTKRTHPAWRRVAIAAMIVICVTLGTAMATPQIRAGVKEAVVEFFDKYTSINFGNTNTSIDLGNGYTMNYLPEGYKIIEKKPTDYFSAYTFSNDENNTIVLSISHTNFSDLLTDNEEAISEVFTINEYNAYLTKSDISNKKSIIWGNSNVTFSITSTLKKDELMEIAKNIK